jgi:hypothetical protein
MAMLETIDCRDYDSRIMGPPRPLAGSVGVTITLRPLRIPDEAKRRLRIMFIAKHARWDGGLHPKTATMPFTTSKCARS